MSIASSLGSFILGIEVFELENSIATVFANVDLAIVLFSGGFNIRVPLLATVSNYINISSEYAQLYTLISMVDTITHILGGLAVEEIWAEVIEL